MSVQEIIDRARDLVTVNRVYGSPIEQDGVMLVPAAKIGGGGGAGEGTQPEGKGDGSGGGLGLRARPAGAFVIEHGEVTWRPAVDVNRAIMAGAAVMLAGVLAGWSVARARSRMGLEHRGAPRALAGRAMAARAARRARARGA